MDWWLLALTGDPAARGSAKDLEVAGAGPVHCHFPLPPFFLTMCSSKRCLSFYCCESKYYVASIQAQFYLAKYSGLGSSLHRLLC